MNLNTENITNLITAVNSDSTSEAVKMFELNTSCGKMKPVIAFLTKFISSFVKNNDKSEFKERLIYSSLDSFRYFLTYLKLLKLKKVI